MKKYNLDKNLAFNHFCKTINNTNELSRSLFILLDLKKNGQFFTYLSTEEDMQDVHNFEYGGLKMNPKNTIVNFLKEKLASNQDYCLIFDDVLEDYKSLCGYDLFENHGIHYENEAYYLIKSKNHPDSNLIKNCIKASDAQWHFLGILSKVDLEHIKNKNLSLEILHNICINADIILTTAYDGEGYIFWEKNNILS